MGAINHPPLFHFQAVFWRTWNLCVFLDWLSADSSNPFSVYLNAGVTTVPATTLAYIWLLRSELLFSCFHSALHCVPSLQPLNYSLEFHPSPQTILIKTTSVSLPGKLMILFCLTTMLQLVAFNLFPQLLIHYLPFIRISYSVYEFVSFNLFLVIFIFIYLSWLSSILSEFVSKFTYELFIVFHLAWLIILTPPDNFQECSSIVN